MNDLFNSGYAGVYDTVYQTKDYDAECDLIEQVFRSYATAPVRSVLDLGCGTGNHVLRLLRRGYEVVGVDSSDHMLAQARKKLDNISTDGPLPFQQGDIRTVHLDRRFDAVIAMFAVMGYQLSNADVKAALTTAGRHLSAGGLLVFDVWYGPAVLHQRPSQTVRTIPIENGEILRMASGELEVKRQLCKIDIVIWTVEGDRIVAKEKEHHANRFFFPLELELLLQNAGFSSLRLGAFPDFSRDPDETTWNVLQVARAI